MPITQTEINDLQHWDFVKLFDDNEKIYTDIYKATYRSIEQRINRPPSIDDMENALIGELLIENNFIDHCDSKNSYNPSFNIDCARQFAKYIVFKLYNVVQP